MQDMTIRLDPTEKIILEAQAAAHGKNLSDLLRDSAALVADVSPFFREKLETFCVRYHLSPSLAIENLVLARLADLEARAEVWGEGPDTLPEFQFGATGPLTGDTLFTILRAQRRDDLETQRTAFLRHKMELTRTESEWLKSHMRSDIEENPKDPAKPPDTSEPDQT